MFSSKGSSNDSVDFKHECDRTFKFMYPSTDESTPLYSMPHLSLTMTGLPVNSFKKGLGFNGTNYICIQLDKKEGQGMV
jgi:hypothetical protein